MEEHGPKRDLLKQKTRNKKSKQMKSATGLCTILLIYLIFIFADKTPEKCFPRSSKWIKNMQIKTYERQIIQSSPLVIVDAD